MSEFKQQVLEGIPGILPEAKGRRTGNINHAPKRKDVLDKSEKILALKNALRYFPAEQHTVLASEFANELEEYGHIYMYRFRPDYEIKARPLDEYPYKSKQAAAIMLMLSNNLSDVIAQHPDELITYGSNGSVFQNWGQ